jgi:glycolate oxidase FAD binding subunit
MDRTDQLLAQVRAAIDTRTPLFIRGGGSKHFYGRQVEATPLEMGAHCGVIAYEPSELVISARAGTPLSEIEALLAKHNQMLPFEPPHFSAAATFGGMLAAGLSGPRRPWAGALRDAVLGVTLINGRGQLLRFGGTVMKNVAGYDLARLMAGSLGNLGVIADATVKVLPRPATELTLMQACAPGAALARLSLWGRRPLPISASLYADGHLLLRLSGSVSGVKAAGEELGGDTLPNAVWQDLREQQLGFFRGGTPLWRLSLPPATPMLTLPGEQLLEWGGALRWLRSDAPAASLFEAARAAGGHATLFRHHDGQGQVFAPLSPALMALHSRIKTAFDPHGLFNRGRLYAGL